MSKVIRFGGAVLLHCSVGYKLADGYNSPPVAPRAYNWTGFYVGANVGYGQHNDDVSFASDPLFFGPAAAVGFVPKSMTVNDRPFLARRTCNANSTRKKNDTGFQNASSV